MSSQADNKDAPGTDIAFFGAITASVSHELNNVISIIDQTAGLLDDLLVGAANGREIKPESLQRVADGITKQTGRGVSIIKRLNRFAHTTDDDRIAYELNEVVENLTELVRRFAERRRVKLSFESTAEKIDRPGNPLLLQRLIFQCYWQLLWTSEANDELMLKVTGEQDQPVIIIEGHSTTMSAETNQADLEPLLDSLGLKLSSEKDGEKVRISLIYI